MSDATRRLLIVEDNERFASTLVTEFRDRGYEVHWAAGLDELRALDDHHFHFAIVDLRLRGDSGLDAISLVKERQPQTRVLVLTGYGSIATAVQATKLGASGYLTKPVDVDEIERALLNGEGSHEEIPIPEEFQSLDRHEREYIEYVLAASNGNISHAARRLGLHRQSLQRKLRKFTPR